MADVFVPLNAFKSVVTKLTGEEDIVYTTPSGVSTIVLSAQLTNNSANREEVTLKMTSNREIPVPQVASIDNEGNFFSASALIALNKDYIKKEVAAYINFNNNLVDIPFGFSQSRYESYVDTAVQAVVDDLILSGSTLRSEKAALSFYDKNGVSLIPAGQVTASKDAVDYANILSKQIILNESVTGSDDVVRLYQTTTTQ